MAAIVKANANLAAGGLAVLKRSVSTEDSGQVTYTANYVCLSQHANRWTPSFATESAPPTPLPANALLLNLTRAPRLINLETETSNGLTYFNATYSVGTNTDVVTTVSSEIRNVSWQIYGNETVTAGFDYVAISVSATATNDEVPVVRGYTGRIFNARNVNPNALPANVERQSIETFSRTKRKRGDYANTVTSTGVYVAIDVGSPVSQDSRPISNASVSATSSFSGFSSRDSYRNIFVPGVSEWRSIGGAQ